MDHHVCRLRDGINAHLGTVRDILTGDLQAAADDAVALAASQSCPRLADLAERYRES